MDPMNPAEQIDRPAKRRPKPIPGGGEELTDEQLELVVGGVSINQGWFGNTSSLSEPTPMALPIPDFLK